MTISLPKAHTRGTHRLLPPEETLRTLEPRLPALGITRCADITGLDYLGIPVFCAIRPQGRLLQVSNGKGLDPVSAKVSALMEAVEYSCYEDVSDCWRRASLAQMHCEGLWTVDPGSLAEYRTGCYFTRDYVIDWEPGKELLTGRQAWLPASAVRIRTPMLFPFSNNGLASGNHPVEATLHGLYELIERDAVSGLAANGGVRIAPPQCRCIDLDTAIDGAVGELVERIRRAGIKLVLIWIASCIRVHTFWAVLLDKNPLGHCSTVNIGYGTHLSASVAATRAITEAAQSRLTFIHGAREDLIAGAYNSGDGRRRLFGVFDRLESTTSWQNFPEMASDDLLQDQQTILERLAGAGYNNIFRVTMGRADLEFSVVRVFVPGLQCNPNLI